MTWQLLIWNMFIWSFTGVIITLNDASVWWLVLPALFTTTQNAVKLYEKASEEDQYELDPETRKKLMSIVEDAERRIGKL